MEQEVDPELLEQWMQIVSEQGELTTKELKRVQKQMDTATLISDLHKGWGEKAPDLRYKKPKRAPPVEENRSQKTRGGLDKNRASIKMNNDEEEETSKNKTETKQSRQNFEEIEDRRKALANEKQKNERVVAKSPRNEEETRILSSF